MLVKSGDFPPRFGGRRENPFFSNFRDLQCKAGDSARMLAYIAYRDEHTYSSVQVVSRVIICYFEQDGYALLWPRAVPCLKPGFETLILTHKRKNRRPRVEGPTGKEARSCVQRYR